VIGAPSKSGILTAGGQKFRDRVVRRHLAAQHHVGQQQRGKHFCDRADLEHGVGIERAIGAGTPVGRHAAPAAVDRRGDDPHRVAGDIHALFQDGGEAVLGH
jgi:hypothetical protein